MIEFRKVTDASGTKYFLSDCEQYKIINYDGSVYLYKKIHGLFVSMMGKKYSAFGESVETDARGKSISYKTYREAMKRLNQLKGN